MPVYPELHKIVHQDSQREYLKMCDLEQLATKLSNFAKGSELAWETSQSLLCEVFLAALRIQVCVLSMNPKPYFVWPRARDPFNSRTMITEDGRIVGLDRTVHVALFPALRPAEDKSAIQQRPNLSVFSAVVVLMK